LQQASAATHPTIGGSGKGMASSRCRNAWARIWNRTIPTCGSHSTSSARGGPRRARAVYEERQGDHERGRVRTEF
jgi:hypothetical protein